MKKYKKMDFVLEFFKEVLIVALVLLIIVGFTYSREIFMIFYNW